MPNRLQKLLYYLSASAPILISFAIVWIIQKKSWTIPLVITTAAIVLIIIFSLSFKYAKKNLPIIPVRVLEINGDDGWIVAYVISYLVPFASLKFSDYIAPVAAGIFIILMLVLTFTDYVSPHPLLFCSGYHFYELNVEGAQHNLKLASRKRLRNSGEVRQVNRVFEFLLLRA